jgi:hypothetical protein
MGQGKEVKTRPDPEVEIQEKGEIFFFYRPKVGKDEAHGPDDVQRMYIVLRPESGRAVEEKQAPDSGKEGRKRRRQGDGGQGGSEEKGVEGGHGKQVRMLHAYTYAKLHCFTCIHVT